jgi:hypothetical protein
MARPQHDWYVKEWLAYYGKKQSDVVKDLDWNKAKISLTASGKQPYDRDDVNEIATWLNLEPFELLLPPDRAMAIRQYRASAEQIVTLAHDTEPAKPENVEKLFDHKPRKPRAGGEPRRKRG